MSEENHSKKFSLFKKKPIDGPSVKPVTIFDETCIDFELKGGPYQTSLIEASAIMKVGPNIGMPLPLKCTWYRATSESQFVTIEGVNGAFYQANADDVGCKICVHAVPVSEVEEYTGMPAFSEIGPIQMDPEVQNTVQDMIRHNSAILIANLTGSNMTSVPNGCVYIKIDSNKLKITHQNDREIVSVDLDKENPKIHILHKTNTGFSLIFDDKKLDFSTEKPVERDIITIAVRMFCNKTVIEDQSDMLFKMQELSSRLFELNKDYELAVSNLNTLKGINEIYLKANENYQKNLQELETDNSELRDKNMKQESMLEKYESELQFLRQDILVYKEQNSSIESKLDQQRIIANDHEFLLTNIKENLIELLRKSHICEKCKNVGTILLEIYARLDGKFNDLDASSSNSSVRSFHDEISESTDENQDKEIREIREKLNLYKNKIKKYKTEKLEVWNKAETEKSFFKRKLESLAAENERLMNKLAKTPKDTSDYEREKELLQSLISDLTKDLKHTKDVSLSYEQLIKSNKKRLDEEIARNSELRNILQKSHTMTAFDYQRIINSLTQTLTDRDEELSQLKILNRDLSQRLAHIVI